MGAHTLCRTCALSTQTARHTAAGRVLCSRAQSPLRCLTALPGCRQGRPPFTGGPARAWPGAGAWGCPSNTKLPPLDLARRPRTLRRWRRTEDPRDETNTGRKVSGLGARPLFPRKGQFVAFVSRALESDDTPPLCSPLSLHVRVLHAPEARRSQSEAAPRSSKGLSATSSPAGQRVTGRLTLRLGYLVTSPPPHTHTEGPSHHPFANRSVSRRGDVGTRGMP